MKLISKNKSEDSFKLEFLYTEISMINGVLGIPNHVSIVPDFEKNVGFTQSAIDEINSRLRLTIENKKDFNEYHKLALRSDTLEEIKKYKTEITLSRKDCFLLQKAFRETSVFTKEYDDFHTLTGHDWSEAVVLQKELDQLPETISVE